MNTHSPPVTANTCTPSGYDAGASLDKEPERSKNIVARLWRMWWPASKARSPVGGHKGRLNMAGKEEHGPPSFPGLSALLRLRVDDVAIPQAEVSAVPLDIGRDELISVFRKSGFSRLPVYEGTLDHPKGLILLKDIALQHGFGTGEGDFLLEPLLRPLLYAPPSMPVAVLLQKMQRERVHMALVIDEYGGVDGLVTIEDLIEPVIGEIEDEHDETEGPLWLEEKPGIFLAQSTAPLDEFEVSIGLRLRDGQDDDEIDTLGGLVFRRSGRVPLRGEVVQHESGVEFEIVDADLRRIKRLRVCLSGVHRAGE